jgi:hypothetical protein
MSNTCSTCGVAEEGFALERSQHAREHALHVVEQVVDDRVVADLHAFALGQVAGLLGGADVEAQDRGPGRLGQLDVGLGDTAGARIDDTGANLVVAHLLQRARDGFARALDVGLDDDRQLADLLRAQLGHHVDQADLVDTAGGLLALHAGAVLGQFTGAGLRFHHGEGFTGGRGLVQTQDLDRNRGSGFLELLVTLVEQGAHLAPGRAGHDDVAALAAYRA